MYQRTYYGYIHTFVSTYKIVCICVSVCVSVVCECTHTHIPSQNSVYWRSEKVEGASKGETPMYMSWNEKAARSRASAKRDATYE